MDLVVKGGRVVTATESFRADIGVDGGKIVAIAENIAAEGARVVDATGKLVLPGAIDVHTHMQLPFGGTVSADDFEGGTRAAAFGGVTTIIDFAIQSKGSGLAETVERRRAEADPKVCIDYSLHLAITDWNRNTRGEIREIIESGIPSFKLFMVYRKEGWMVDDGALFGILSEVAKYGGLVGVHAENAFIIDALVEQFLAEGRLGCEYHPRSRPNFVEGEAIRRAIYLTRAAGGNLYIFHMSTEEGVEAVAEGRALGVRVQAETCPQYLLLTEERYLQPDGHHYAICPPLRSPADSEALWEALADGTIQVIASDHCPFDSRQKALWEGNFTKIPMGLPGVETLLPLALSEGVGKGRFSLNRCLELLSTNPAKIFGLYPQKGTIGVGSDADLVIVDPEMEVTLSPQQLHTAIDYSPYQGMRLKGYPVVTISRGEVIVEYGEFLGRPGRGRFLPRSGPCGG